MPHYCENHPSEVAIYGPVKGKFYCDKFCHNVAYEIQAKASAYATSASDTHDYAMTRRIRRRDGAIVGWSV